MKVKRKKFELPHFKPSMKLSSVNIEYLLECYEESFRSSGNPIDAWMAIHFGIRAEEPLPDWVLAYLAECSGRMVSKRDASDLRMILPEILGFPKKRRGPGKPLSSGDRRDNPDKGSFTRKFVNYVMQGDDPKTARDSACNDMSRKFADKYDDKALVKILVDEMGLPETPQSPEQWKRIVLLYATEWLVEFTRRDASKTKKDVEELRARADKLWGFKQKKFREITP